MILCAIPDFVNPWGQPGLDPRVGEITDSEVLTLPTKICENSSLSDGSLDPVCEASLEYSLFKL